MLNSARKLTSLYASEIAFEKIRDDLDIPLVLEELGLNTYEYHDELWCPCPLPMGNHKRGDLEASFSVNIKPGKRYGLYNCFVCGGGTIIDLVSHLNGCGKEEAIAFLETVGKRERKIEDDVGSKSSRQEFIKQIRALRDRRSGLVEEEDQMPYMDEEQLFGFRYIHPWTLEQGMTEEAVKHFGIGYDMRQQGITFPHWWNGKLVGWQTRDLTGTRRAKYLNTPNFPKRNTIYHLDECVSGQSEVFVVESPKTTVVLWGRGIKNVVATFGASITPEQMAPLWEFQKVYLWFDNDNAGVNATRTAIQLLEQQVRVWVVPVPDFDKADPADIPENLLQSYIARAIPATLWKARNK